MTLEELEKSLALDFSRRRHSTAPSAEEIRLAHSIVETRVVPILDIALRENEKVMGELNAARMELWNIKQDTRRCINRLTSISNGTS